MPSGEGRGRATGSGRGVVGGGLVESAFPLGAMDSHYSWAVRRAHPPFTSSLWEKLSGRLRLRGMLQNNWTGLLKNAKVMTDKDRPH